MTSLSKTTGILINLFLLLASCGEKTGNFIEGERKSINSKPGHPKAVATDSRVIVIQPFDDFASALSNKVYQQLKEIHPTIVRRKAISLPANAYNTARNRYRADSLIHYLGQFGNDDTVIIGLTGKDIGTTKGTVADWGVMGLGYSPGNACIVSTFRLKKENLYEQFYKVAIHELGHTQGLPHCDQKTCFMRDAKGGNPLNEEKEFCVSCKTFLRSKGWTLK